MEEYIEKVRRYLDNPSDFSEEEMLENFVQARGVAPRPWRPYNSESQAERVCYYAWAAAYDDNENNFEEARGYFADAQEALELYELLKASI